MVLDCAAAKFGAVSANEPWNFIVKFAELADDNVSMTCCQSCIGYGAAVPVAVTQSNSTTSGARYSLNAITIYFYVKWGRKGGEPPYRYAVGFTPSIAAATDAAATTCVLAFHQFVATEKSVTLNTAGLT